MTDPRDLQTRRPVQVGETETVTLNVQGLRRLDRFHFRRVVSRDG